MRSFDDIFSSVIGDWPESIDLSGAGVPPPDAEGHYFPELSLAWRTAEARPAEGTFEALMVWSIFGVLHRHAMRLSRQAIFELKPREVPLAEYEEQFWVDLHSADWAPLLGEYERPVNSPAV